MAQLWMWPAVLGLSLGGWAIPARAGSSNGVQTLNQGALCASGGVSSNSLYRLRAAAGLPWSGVSGGSAVRLQAQFGALPLPTEPTFTMTVPVTGTVTGSPEAVLVNGEPATVQGSTFSANVLLMAGPNPLAAVASYADGTTQTYQSSVMLDLPSAQKTPAGSIPVQGIVTSAVSSVTVNGAPAELNAELFEAAAPVSTGYNVLTAAAADAAGNMIEDAVGIFVPAFTARPSIPTVASMPAVAAGSSAALQGTKTSGTTIWVNGQPVPGDPGAESWQFTAPLVEGENVFWVAARDANGVFSASARVVLILDEAPPVVAFTPPGKTNLNPVPVEGAVDDSLTTVSLNGIQAARSGLEFSANIPLNPGPNDIVVEAISPNGHLTTQSHTVTLGSVPLLVGMTPQDGTLSEHGRPLEIQLEAADAESDPVQYRVLMDGFALCPWAGAAAFSWTPDEGETGLRTLQFEARDDFGGADVRTVEIFVARSPIAHPNP